MVSEPFWIYNTEYLFKHSNFIPESGLSPEENLNRFTRFIIVCSILIGYVTRSTRPLYLGLFAIAAIGILYFLSHKQMNRSEAFGNLDFRPAKTGAAIPIGLYGPSGSLSPMHTMAQHYGAGGSQESLLYKANNPTRVSPSGFLSGGPSPYQTPMLNYGIGPQAARITSDVVNAPNPGAFFQDPVLRAPTRNNPFMNVMPLDYDAPPVFSDYNRYEKLNYPTPDSQQIREEVKSEFEDGLFQNASGMLWNRTNSQREYVSQPVGSVPSDQAEYANWLYGTGGEAGGKNCKAGSIWDRYGLQYTDDSLLCTGFNVASPTNKGLLNGGLMSSVAQSPGMY